MVLTKPSARPVPFARGLLAEKPVAQLLAYVLDRKMTGSFELGGEAGEMVRIAVCDGLVSRVESSRPIDFLGQVLYEAGTIDEAALRGSLRELAATKRLHGQILLAKGMLDRPGLADGLRRQRTRKLHQAFELSPASTFAFYPCTDLVGERPDDVEPMDPLPSMWRAVLRNPPWEHVRSALTTIGERRLSIVGAIDRIGLEDAELEAVERLRRTDATVAELPRLMELEPRAADLLAYFLVITKMASLGPRGGSSTPPVPEPPSSRPALGGHGVSLASGEYTRTISFTMRAVRGDREVRIASPPAPVPPESAAPGSARSGESLRPKGPAVSPAAEHALSQAEMHLVLGNLGQAIACAREALSKAPGLPEAQALLGYVRVLGPDAEAKQNLLESLRLVNAALRTKDECRKGYYYRAQIRMRLDDHAGAIEDLRLAVARDPQDIEAQRELAIYELKVRDGSIRLDTHSTAPDSKSNRGLLDRLRGRRG
jgi:tetratricopeptide (TPR) repeat protein